MRYLLVGSVIFILGACCKAGDGGDATLKVYLKHHGKTIPNKTGYPDTVMVKYKSKDFPGSKVSDYDAIFIGKPGEDFVSIEELRCGNYFLFGVGMDTTGPYRVIGGEAFSIKHKDKDRAFIVDLSVTE